MRTLRYLLITFAVMMVMNVHAVYAHAQSLATEPQYGFQSTSSMAGSGSTLPQAAVEGAYTTYETGATRSGSGIRKGSWNPNPGDEPGPDEGDNDEPYQNPIGESMWALLALACCYAAFAAWRKRNVKTLNR